VRTQEVGLSENFGRFEAVIAPGLHLQCWPCATIAARLSLRIQQFNVLVETKTEDHVFCHVQITVQYRIIPEMAYFAYYRLQQPQLQLQSHILDVVRAAVPLMTVDQLYQSKQRVANAVHERLASVLCEYGYDIVTALVTHITPTPTVQWAMNEVEACRREKLAKPQIAEARQIQIIKQAEAQAEADYLQGVGVAKQRREIYAGLRENARELENDFEHVMDILLLTQYFDLLAHMGANEMFVRAVPGEVMNIQQGLKGREHVNCYDDDSSSGIDGACNEEEDVEEEKSAGVDNEKFAMHLLEGEIA
jgi:regulator of protease activity HflC (stomatin/prohibitin superfamily)